MQGIAALGRWKIKSIFIIIQIYYNSRFRKGAQWVVGGCTVGKQSAHGAKTAIRDNMLIV